MSRLNWLPQEIRSQFGLDLPEKSPEDRVIQPDSGARPQIVAQPLDTSSLRSNVAEILAEAGIETAEDAKELGAFGLRKLEGVGPVTANRILELAGSDLEPEPTEPAEAAEPNTLRAEGEVLVEDEDGPAVVMTANGKARILRGVVTAHHPEHGSFDARREISYTAFISAGWQYSWRPQ